METFNPTLAGLTLPSDNVESDKMAVVFGQLLVLSHEKFPKDVLNMTSGS